MKKFATLILLIGMVGCKEPNEKNQTGLSTSLMTNDLKYFVYAWYYPRGKWEFYLDRYVSIDRNGNFISVFRDSSNKSLYYTGSIDGELAKLINKTFLVDTLKADYKSDSLQNIAYSGYTYCFDYSKGNSLERKKVLFIQSRSPELIKNLSTQLDNLHNQSKATRVDTLDVGSSIEEFRRFSATSLGEPPKLEKPKFDPTSH